ncbi:MAG: Ig-like domain-containing protein [Bryobacteraceae bacterium]|nr:Ig-like domain-containing protein [Bryobacterales bacterium]NUN00614.1 Ig-like domain-containing protein [Bryobacteraceae bacterium]
MATALLTDCSQTKMPGLERVRYFPRQLLSADDMVADQEYFRTKLRRHNRFLHGWGTVCGLEVAPAPAEGRPWQVQIASGYALGPYGDEIYVRDAVLLDLAECGPGAETDPCAPGFILRGNVSRTGATLYVALRYEECLSRPVRVLPGGCGCEDISCETSRIRDSFVLECLTELPPSHTMPPGPSLCDLLRGRALAQCPPCPTDPWVVLAQVRLPADSSTTISADQIDNFIRRQVFSTAAIQDQVIRCCCGPQERRPARVTSINPPPNSRFTSGAAVPAAVVITFSKNLQAQTVNTDTVQVLRFLPNQPAVFVSGQVTYDDGNRVARFTPAAPFTQNGIYQVNVAGSGPNPIEDADNLALDGNDDGLPGGNFVSQFTIEAPSTTPTPTPTPTPGRPLRVRVATAGDIPNVTSNNEPGSLARLALVFSGGIPGQEVEANLMVFLNVNVATSAGPAVLLNRVTGEGMNAQIGQNNYAFPNAKFTMPATGGDQSFEINRMAVIIPRGTPNVPQEVTAFVSVTSATPITVENPQVTVAFVS